MNCEEIVEPRKREGKWNNKTEMNGLGFALRATQRKYSCNVGFSNSTILIQET